MKKITTAIIALASAAALAACVEQRAAPRGDEAPKAAAATPGPFTEAGVAVVLKPEASTGDAASVTAVIHSRTGEFKIFDTAGGDPAINGLFTYFATFDEDEKGWTAYRVGDFNSWKIIEDRGAQGVLLEVSRSWIAQDTGEANTVTEHLLVTRPDPAADEVRVTPMKAG